jgi:MFS family permease
VPQLGSTVCRRRGGSRASWACSFSVGSSSPTTSDLTGSVLPSLTQQFGLSTGMKSFVAVAANIGIVIGIVPAGRLADHFGRRKVLIVGTAAYAILTFSPVSCTVWTV